MTEVWLRNNTRAFAAALVIPALAGLLGWALAAGTLGHWGGSIRVGLGVALAAISLLAMLILVWQLRRPRLALHDGKLLLYLRWSAPIAVPIEIVEAFMLGQRPTLLPGKMLTDLETQTLVVHLSESAEQWGHIDVDQRLGAWCNHWVTIRGTWCERLSLDVVNRLNEKLAEANHRHRPEPAAR